MKRVKQNILKTSAAALLLTTTASFGQYAVPEELEFSAKPNGDVSIYTQPKTTETIGQMRSSFYNNTLVAVDEKDHVAYNIQLADEGTVIQRLRSIEGRMPLTYNQTVSQFINFFMVRRPSFTKQMLEKKEFYFPVFEKYLAKYNMPDELKYLSLLESGLNPKAVSRAKAVGLWQFMPVTGREQGLTIDEYIDERMHIEKSTDAACRYLRTLYNMFGNWDLALASYNSGPGTVRRAIRRSGSSDYWSIHSFIPADTRTYVPQFIAIMYMMNYSAEHGIFPENTIYPIATRSIYTNGYFDLKKFSELSHIDYEKIKFLNPHIKKDILPAYLHNFEIKLPSSDLAHYDMNQGDILAQASIQPYVVPTTTAGVIYNAEPIAQIVYPQAQESNIVEDIEPVQTTVKPKKVAVNRTVRKSHKVRRGENLSQIADRYNVTMAEIKKWNKLRSSKIMAGQVLKINVSETKYIQQSSSVASSQKSSSSSKKSGSKSFYTVKSGDTLWSISQRNNLTINEMKRLNNLRGNTVKVGQRLKVS